MNHSKNIIPIAAALGALLVAPTTRSEETQTLPEITVTASPTTDAGYVATHSATATKTDTPIFDLPVSLQVVPREVMEDRQVFQFQKALENVSGVVPNYGGADLADSARVRGFFVNAYRDGYRGRSFGNLSTSTADLERVEVLKGPASVLYGRTEPGGFINQVSKEPLAAPYYSLQQQFGSFDLYRTTLDAAGPLTGDDTLLYRVNVEYLNSGSFRELNEAESIFVAPVLTWNLSDQTWIRFNARYFDGERSSDRGLIASGEGIAPIPIERNLGEPWAVSEVEDLEAGVTFSHDFNQDWNLKMRFATQQFDGHFLDVDFDDLLPDNRTLPRSAFDDLENFANYSTTLDLTGRFETWGIRHTALLGADYYNEAFDAQFASPSLGSIDIFNPVHTEPRPSTPFVLQTGNIEDYGAYFQDQIDLRESLHLLGGGRYDWATTERRFGDDPADETKDEAFSSRVGLVYQPLPWLALYGSYVESFGSANSGLSRTGEAFKPETGTQYEAGLKAESLNGRLGATLALYHLTKQNILTPDPVDPNFSVQTGEARSRGIELDLSGEITPGWNIIAAYAYTDAEITQSNFGDEGNRLGEVPRHSGSLWTRYRFLQESLSGLSLGGGAYFAGRREGDDDNSFQLPGYGRVDLLAAYEWKVGPSKLTAQFNVENLLDKEYFTSAGRRNQIIPGAPRSFIGSLRIEY